MRQTSTFMRFCCRGFPLRLCAHTPACSVICLPPRLSQRLSKTLLLLSPPVACREGFVFEMKGSTKSTVFNRAKLAPWPLDGLWHHDCFLWQNCCVTVGNSILTKTFTYIWLKLWPRLQTSRWKWKAVTKPHNILQCKLAQFQLTKMKIDGGNTVKYQPTLTSQKWNSIHFSVITPSLSAFFFFHRSPHLSSPLSLLLCVAVSLWLSFPSPLT